MLTNEQLARASYAATSVIALAAMGEVQPAWSDLPPERQDDFRGSIADIASGEPTTVAEVFAAGVLLGEHPAIVVAGAIVVAIVNELA